GGKSAVMFAPTPISTPSRHRPDRSGLPPVALGAGAEGFALPSGVRGIPGVGCLSHWAGRDILATPTVTRAIAETRISTLFMPLVFSAWGRSEILRNSSRSGNIKGEGD